jgi:uncharacterized protein (DUF1501 family)
MTTRRIFLKSSAMAMVGMGAAPAWLSRALYAQDAPSPRKKILVAIFQRGAMDGLNAVVPFGEQRYYDLRPNLALPKPNGTPDSAIDLDGFFGLHPSLAPLKPLWDKGQLACVHAAGSPDPTRSHFDAQDYMESGTPGRKGTSDGWLNRALTPQQIISPVRAVSLGSALPRALRGRNDAVAVNNLNEFQVRDQRSSTSFESMYAGTLDKVLNGTGRETFDAVKLMQSIQKQTYTPANGARYPGGRLGPSLMQIARLIKADVGLEGRLHRYGWLGHARQRSWSQVVAGPACESAERARAINGCVLSRPGRSHGRRHRRHHERVRADCAREWKSRHRSRPRECDVRAGRSIKGGKVYGDWPGLEPEQLYEQRDLNLTTDFRDVLGELVTVHLGNREIKNVFPGYTEPKFRGLVTA